MVSMASGESTVRNGAENSSTTVVSQGFLDLLFDRDGWLQSTENTLTQSLQTTREEIHGFTSDPTSVAATRAPIESDQLPSERTYDLPVSVHSHLNSSNTQVSKNLSNLPLLNEIEGDHNSLLHRCPDPPER